MPKKSGDNSKPPLIAQPNGGKLYAGGVPGNKGGTGRPSNLARQMAAEALVTGIPKMQALMANAKDDSNKIQAFNALAKLLPQQIGEDPDSPFQSLTEAQRKARLKSLLG